MQKRDHINKASGNMEWIHLVSVLRDHALHIPTLSLCMTEGQEKGLRGITSSSFGDEEGIWDIIFSMLIRKFLTHCISGGSLGCNKIRC